MTASLAVQLGKIAICFSIMFGLSPIGSMLIPIGRPTSFRSLVMLSLPSCLGALYKSLSPGYKPKILGSSTSRRLQRIISAPNAAAISAVVILSKFSCVTIFSLTMIRPSLALMLSLSCCPSNVMTSLVLALNSRFTILFIASCWLSFS